MSFSAKELIKQRKSVRTFDGKPLSEEDKKELENYIGALANPFDVPVTARLLDVQEHRLSSPVVVGENEYIAAKIERGPHCELGYWYSFEKLCLYALSRGIGTVMLALAIDRPAFEKAMEVQPNEIMPVATPVGYPAEKKSVREAMMRKGLKADGRKPFDSIFFDRSFEHGLEPKDAGVFADALEGARWAPSAGNSQPWRAVVDGNKVHFYKAIPPKEFPHWDAQELDVGIALAHFEAILEENGVTGAFVFADPCASVPQNIRYVVTYERD